MLHNNLVLLMEKPIGHNGLCTSDMQSRFTGYQNNRTLHFYRQTFQLADRISYTVHKIKQIW